MEVFDSSLRLPEEDVLIPEKTSTEILDDLFGINDPNYSVCFYSGAEGEDFLHRIVGEEYGYEYDATLNEAVWSITQGKTTADQLWGAYCLRSGRDALKAIAREYTPRIVLLPALACDSMVFPFKLYGHQVQYYKLNKENFLKN